MALEGLQLRSLVTDGELRLSLEPTTFDDPAPDEVVVRMEAAPVNPSDMALLFGGLDTAQARYSGKETPVVTIPVPEANKAALAGRVGLSLPVGTEGAGVVVKAGAEAQHLLGKRVAIFGGAMYSHYRTIRGADCLVLPDGVSAREGAACFANPLTALSMIETMKREGHAGLVHTAAASNLGQMLVKACVADGVPLVNVVRRQEQEDLLRGIGATHVVNMTKPSFVDDLTRALGETGATIAFDAIGGGKIAGQILTAMETAAIARMETFSRYGSATFKQLYMYGFLDPSPTEFNRNFGMLWSMGGWLLTPFLARIGPEAANALRQRVVRDIKTTFSSNFTRVVSFPELLGKDAIDTYTRRATGEKILVDLTAA